MGPSRAQLGITPVILAGGAGDRRLGLTAANGRVIERAHHPVGIAVRHLDERERVIDIDVAYSIARQTSLVGNRTDDVRRPDLVAPAHPQEEPRHTGFWPTGRAFDIARTHRLYFAIRAFGWRATFGPAWSFAGRARLAPRPLSMVGTLGTLGALAPGHVRALRGRVGGHRQWMLIVS